MTISRATLAAAAVQQHHEQVRNEERHRTMLDNDRHIKERLRDNEQYRIEANRRMMRNGQNVDKIA